MQNEQSIKSAIQEQFGKNSAKYVTSQTHAQGEDLARLVEWLEPEASWVALDIATGGGHAAKTLSPKVRTLFATDFTREMLAAARAHLDESCSNIHYVAADAEALPFLDASFDAVTCRIAAHHFPSPGRFIQEVERVLKPGGRFVLIDNVAPADESLDQFINTAEKLRDESHVRAYTVNQWTQWMEDAQLVHEKSNIRKKRIPFESWVQRMAADEAQEQRVREFMLAAGPEAKAYFSIREEDGDVTSFELDEWMVLVTKPHGDSII